MGVRWIVPAGLLVFTGCTTVSLSHLDRCTFRHTQTIGGSHDEVLFCDEDPPRWSSDRAVRLAQECLRIQYELRRDQLIAAGLTGKPIPMPGSGPAFTECFPESLRVIQSENEHLKGRLAELEKAETELKTELAATQSADAKQLSDTRSESSRRVDEAEARLERNMHETVVELATEHAALEGGLTDGLKGLTAGMTNGLTGLSSGYAGVATGVTSSLAKALERPVNVSADARSSSDSGADSRHQSTATTSDPKIPGTSPDTRVNVNVGAQPRPATPAGAPVKKVKICAPAPASTPAGPSLADQTVAPAKN